MKIKPGKEQVILLALTIMKSLKIYPQIGETNKFFKLEEVIIEDVNLVSGPYDMEFILKGENIDDIIKIVHNIRETFGKAGWIDDTLTLISYRLQNTSDEASKQYHKYCKEKPDMNKSEELDQKILQNIDNWRKVLSGMLDNG